MLGKRAVPATRRKIEKKWKEGNSSDEDEEKPVTDADFDDFRRRNEEEEKEERRRKWAEAQEKKRIEDLAASKRGRTKAFEWMDSDDECDEAEEDDDTGKKQKTENGQTPSAPSVLPFPGAPHAPHNPVTTAQAAAAQQDAHNKAVNGTSLAPCFLGREHLFKTRVCQRWAQGYCQWGNDCAFAHGEDELKRSIAAKASGSTASAKIPVPAPLPRAAPKAASLDWREGARDGRGAVEHDDFRRQQTPIGRQAPKETNGWSSTCADWGRTDTAQWNSNDWRAAGFGSYEGEQRSPDWNETQAWPARGW